MRIALLNDQITGKTEAVRLLSGLLPCEVALIGGEGHAMIPGTMDGWGLLSELYANLVEGPGLFAVENALGLVRVKMDVAFVDLGECIGRPGTFPVQDGLDQDGHGRMVLVGDHRSNGLGAEAVCGIGDLHPGPGRFHRHGSARGHQNLARGLVPDFYLDLVVSAAEFDAVLQGNLLPHGHGFIDAALEHEDGAAAVQGLGDFVFQDVGRKRNVAPVNDVDLPPQGGIVDSVAGPDLGGVQLDHALLNSGFGLNALHSGLNLYLRLGGPERRRGENGSGQENRGDQNWDDSFH